MTKLTLIILITCLSCCKPRTSGENKEMPARSHSDAPVRLVTLDPGHFHAALIQKTMYPDVDSVVHVYAPPGADEKLHLDRIQSYNTREKDPTHWAEEVYTGSDFFERMIAEKAGNVVVLSGNNKRKTEYILKSLQTGFNVLADKPMVIDHPGFEALKQAFALAGKNDLLLYDIMTERFEITNMLQRELSMLPEVFGSLEKGTAENPAITKESVHHFYKYVSGKVLTRPAWFLDVTQQGEGIVDVMTHLVDLVQWECFPERALDYPSDIQVTTAKRWTTEITLGEFKALTQLETFPDYLKSNVSHDTLLKVSCNGEIRYRLLGVHAKTSVTWAYKAPEGAGDTHYSVMRGTKARLIIRQGADQQFKPVLYVEPVGAGNKYENIMKEQLKTIQNKYPGVDLKKIKIGWEVIIPEHYKEGHEAHFGRVTQKFLEYLKTKKLPAWEVPNMLAKYYTTTRALQLAKHK